METLTRQYLLETTWRCESTERTAADQESIESP